MSTNPNHTAFDDLIRDQMSQLKPEVPQGVWEGLDAQLDQLNQRLQFDEAVRESIDKLQVNPPAGVFEAIQSQLGSIGSGIGSGLGLAGKWILGSVIGAGLTIGTYYAVNHQASDENKLQPTEVEALAPSTPVEITQKEGEESKQIEGLAEVPEGQIQNSPSSSENTSPSQMTSGSNTPANGTSGSPVQGTKTAGKANGPTTPVNPPAADPVVPKNTLNPMVGFSAHDTMLCAGQEYRLFLTEADECTYQLYINGALVATRKGTEPFIQKMNETGLFLMECHVIHHETQKKYSQIIYVNPLPDNRIELHDLGKGKYSLQFPADTKVDWKLDGALHTGNEMQFYDELPKDHTVEASIANQFGCINRGTLTFRNNFIFEISAPKIPNVFTPDGDGKNDVFRIESKGTTYYRLIILNAQGQMVFQSNDPEASWDGKDLNRGNGIHTGYYTCILEYALAGGEIVKETERVELR